MDSNPSNDALPPEALPPGALALLAHELRTPLNALMGYADAMRGAAFGPLPAPYDGHAEIIHRAAEHLLALVDDMTDIASAEAGVWSGRRERFDPVRLVEEIVALLAPRAARAAVTIRTDFAGAPGEMLADRRAIGQLLINLLDNALKFTATGGEILVALGQDGGDARLMVTDSGRGDRPDPDRGKGQGLGLRLARAICGLHGGTIRLDRRPGAGLSATVRLAVTGEA